MIKFLSYFFASLFFCIATMAMEKHEPHQKNLDEEDPEITLKIDTQELLIWLDRKFFEISRQNASQLFHHPTGYSPKKANTLYSLRTPIHKQVKPQSTLVITRTKARRNLLSEFEQNPEPAGCEVHIDFTEFKDICSSETAFSSSQWALHDIWNPKSSVAVDCDHELWPKLIENMIDELSFDSQEDFIALAIIAIHRHLPRIQPALYYDKTDKLVCRHFATIALPVFSKILEHDGSYINGKIHQIIGDFLDQDWRPRQEGHAWNLVKIKEEDEDDGDEEYWLVDAYNKFFINISAPYMKDLTIHQVQDREGSKNYLSAPLKKDSNSWKYAELTREKFKLGITHGRLSLYQNESVRKRMAEKYVTCFRYPSQDLIVLPLEPQ
jgi:hypothetical protein